MLASPVADGLWLCLAACALLPALVNAALFPAKTPVVQLSSGNFKREVLDIEKPTLVAFTAPWCGHCQRMAPEFHRAASNLDGIVKFANIDCDEDVNKGICAQYQIQGFPTVKLFPATKKRLPRDYRGERTAKALIEFAKDTLPLGARKLNGEELDGWVNQAPHRPKVILFSNKPKSSPLYRSLALDFRKTIDFAFMRGDEGLVRSSGRLVLGVDIPTAETLPVLLIVPARQKDDDGNFPPIEKGTFEAYEGALKYHRIKAWLDDVAPRMGVKAGKKTKGSAAGTANNKEATKPKKEKAAKSNTQGSPKAKSAKKPKVDIVQEDVPEGGFVEWKAQKPAGRQAPFASREREDDDEAENSKHEDVKAKDKEGDSEIVDEPIIDESAPGKETWKGKMLDIERAGEIADKLREEAAEVGRRTRKFASMFNPTIKEDATGDASESSSGDSLLDKAKAAAGSVVDSAAKVYKDTTGGGGGEPFERKSKALMAQFQKWMAGENPQGWEEDLGDAYGRAQKEAEEMLRKDPEEAAKQAWKSEEWLLEQMRTDRERMLKVMTPEQRAQVENMIELIEKRLEKKDRTNPFERESGDGSQFPFDQEMSEAQKTAAGAVRGAAEAFGGKNKKHTEL